METSRDQAAAKLLSDELIEERREEQRRENEQDAARDTECRFTPAWQPGTDANLQRAGKQPSAAQTYDYERIIDLISRIRECADVVERELPARTPESNQRARNYAAQVEVDVRELQQELLERHLAILKEARQRV